MKVAKASAFDNTLSVAEDVTLSKDLYVADDLWVSGAISTNLFQHFAPKFIEGLSGSITNLVGGTSYIAAGANITVTSASNGQIVIASVGASGDITSVIAGDGLQGGATSGAATLAVNDSVIATVTGSNTFANDQIFGKDIQVADDLWVSGAMKVAKPSTFDTTLTVTEDGTFSKDLYIADDLWVSGGMRVSKATIFDNTVTIVEDASLSKDLYVADDLWVSGTLNAEKLVSFNSGISIRSQSKTGIFVDNSANIVDVLEFGPAGTDVGLVVSGAIGSAKATAGSKLQGCTLFGGDIVVSGTLRPEGGSRIQTKSGIRGATIQLFDEDDVAICFTNTGASGGVTVTLPEIAQVGSGKVITITDGGNSANVNNITVNVGDGTNDRIYVGSAAVSTVMNIAGIQLRLVSYIDVNLTPDNGWFQV